MDDAERSIAIKQSGFSKALLVRNQTQAPEESMRSLILPFVVASMLCVGYAQQSNNKAAESKKDPAPTSANSQQINPPKAQESPKEPDCGCENKPVPDVLAIVNGISISNREIEELIKDQVSEIHQQVISARSHEMEMEINSRLLATEAKKRGASVSDLIKNEVLAKVKEPTDAETQAFYDQNKSRIGADFKAVKNELIAYLRTQRQREEAKKLADRLRASAIVQVLEDKPYAPKNATDRDRVLAKINGENVTSGDIEDNLKPVIFSAQQQIYNLRKKELELRINDVLLEREAQKRGITTKALLDAELVSKAKKIGETDAQAFYDANKEKINGEFAQVKTQLIAYLQEQQQGSAEIAFADQLRKTATIQIFITAPEPPVYSISTDDQPVKGNKSAPVTIIEFTDYQCPTCAQQQPIIEDLMKEYGDKVKLVIRDFPLNQHPDAFKAAEAAEAAREQGKYWEYIAILFQHQSALGVDKLKEYASQLNLNRDKFDAALESGRLADSVRRDIQDGMKLGLNSTPTIFINGRKVNEKTREALKAAIEASLKTREGIAAAGSVK